MEKKLFIGIGIITVILLIGGYWLVSKQDERLNKPLIGQDVSVQGRNHVSVGIKIDYNSNPPAAGPHYDETAHAGIYDKTPEDGYLVHSLEHGAVILWYKQDLPKSDIERLKSIFNKISGKTIMTPRKNLDVPVALSSWGKVLKLKDIDKNQIEVFFQANMNRAPENAPI